MLHPRGFVLVAVAAAAALAADCGRSTDPVAALLASVERAAEARDADAVGRHLAADFAGMHGLDRAATLDQLRRWLAAYESVAIGVTGVETTREADEARVRCVVEFSGRTRRAFGLGSLLPPEAVYRFEVELVHPGEEWLVRHATWEPVGS